MQCSQQAVSQRRQSGSFSSITRRRHSLRNGMGASTGMSRLPDRGHAIERAG